MADILLRLSKLSLDVKEVCLKNSSAENLVLYPETKTEGREQLSEVGRKGTLGPGACYK